MPNVWQESPPVTPSYETGRGNWAQRHRDGAEISQGFITEADVSSFPPHQGVPQTAATKIIKPPVPLFEDLDLENFDPGGEAAEVLRRKRSLYRLPAIITPRRDERGRHIEDADDGKNMPLNAVVRRYFFGEEKPMAFLRHFDVRLQADERPEKLLGGHVHDADPAAMRYYYTDFLMQPEFQPPMEDTHPVIDLDEMKHYIDSVRPRTRLDVYPLYLLLKGVLRTLLEEHTHICSARERDFQAQLNEMRERMHWLEARNSEERRVMLERLNNYSNQLADAKAELVRYQEEAIKIADAKRQLEGQLSEAKAILSSSPEEMVNTLKISDRIDILNLLIGQTEVASYLDANIYVESAVLGAQDKLVKTILTKMLETEGDAKKGNVTKLVSRIFGLNTDEEMVKMLKEGIENYGFNLTSHMVGGPFQDSEQGRMAFLKQALEMTRSDKQLLELTRGDNSNNSDSTMLRNLLTSYGLATASDVAAARAEATAAAAAGAAAAAADKLAGLASAEARRSLSRGRSSAPRANTKGISETPKRIPSSASASASQDLEITALKQELEELKRQLNAKREEPNGYLSGERGSGGGGDGGAESFSGISKEEQDAHLASLISAERASPSPEESAEDEESERPTDAERAAAQERARQEREKLLASQNAPAVRQTQERETQTEKDYSNLVRGTSITLADVMQQLQEDLGEDFARQIQEWKRPQKSHFISRWAGIAEGASADEIKKQFKPGTISIGTALKLIAELFQSKMERDKESDAQQKQRQGFPEFVRDFFVQQSGLQSMAKKKLIDLLYFTMLENEKGSNAHPRIQLFFRLVGLQEKGSTSEEVENSVECVSFLLLLVQEIFPSWRYGAAFIKEFGNIRHTLPLEPVEYALDRVFLSKKYGGKVPERLLTIIQQSADEVEKTQKKKVVTKASRPKQMMSDDIRSVDADFVLNECHQEFLKLEHQATDLLLVKYNEVDDNRDGVLQYAEFCNFISQIDSSMSQEEIMQMYQECVGDDDVIDRGELFALVTNRGLLFNLAVMNLED